MPATRPAARTEKTQRDGESQVVLQGNLFGPPEPVDSYPQGSCGRGDDLPVPAERELLWPADLAERLGPALLERLYGDIPRRTRLHVREVCRRLRCDSEHVYNLRRAGSLDSVDISSPEAEQRREWRFYRYSLVRWLFNREFRDSAHHGEGGRSNLTPEDMQRIVTALQETRDPQRKEVPPRKTSAR